jgi:hypothetical protein
MTLADKTMFVVGVALLAFCVIGFAMPAHADDCVRYIQSAGNLATIPKAVFEDCMRTGYAQAILTALAGMVGGALIGQAVARTLTPPGHKKPTPDDKLAQQKIICDRYKKSRADEAEMEQRVKDDEQQFVVIANTMQSAIRMVTRAQRSWIAAKFRQSTLRDAIDETAVIASLALLFGGWEAFEGYVAAGATLGDRAMARLAPNPDEKIAQLEQQYAVIDAWTKQKLAEAKFNRDRDQRLLTDIAKQSDDLLGQLIEVEGDLRVAGVPFQECKY